MKRGEVWWADLLKPIGRRPVLLLSRDSAYKIRNAVTVAPLTRTIRNIPVEVKLGPEDAVPPRCVVTLDNLTTIPKSLVKERIAVLSPEKMQQVEDAVRFALGLSS